MHVLVRAVQLLDEFEVAFSEANAGQPLVACGGTAIAADQNLVETENRIHAYVIDASTMGL